MNPFYSDGLKILSLNEPINLVARISLIFNLRFFIFFVVYFCMSVIALKFILERSMSAAALETLRIFVSGSSVYEPRYISPKIFLITIVIAAFAASSSLQNRLSAISTVPRYKETIDSIQDSIKSNLTVYGPPDFKELLSSQTVRQRYHDTLADFANASRTSCFDRLSKGDHVACLRFESFLPRNIQEAAQIHVSKSNLFEGTHTFVHAEDLPLSYKLNWILSKSNDGGFVKLFHDSETSHHKTNNKFDTLESSDQEELFLGYWILFVGWALAVFTFVFEFCISNTIRNRHDELRKIIKAKISQRAVIVRKTYRSIVV